MILLIFLSLTIEAAEAQAMVRPHTSVAPADWSCAEPLIQRNYSRSVEPMMLALRIADECARPYRARPVRTDVERAFEQRERLNHTLGVRAFESEIEERIWRAKRRDTIPLH